MNKKMEVLNKFPNLEKTEFAFVLCIFFDQVFFRRSRFGKGCCVGDEFAFGLFMELMASKDLLSGCLVREMESDGIGIHRRVSFLKKLDWLNGIRIFFN